MRGDERRARPVDPPLLAGPAEVVERAPGVFDGAARVVRRGAVGPHDPGDRFVPAVVVAGGGTDRLVPALLRDVRFTAEGGDASLAGEEHRELVAIRGVDDPLEAGDAVGERGVGRGELAGVIVDERQIHGGDADDPVVLAPPGGDERFVRHEPGAVKVALGVRAEREVRERHSLHGPFAVEKLAGPAPPIGGGRDLSLADVLEPFEEAGIAVAEPITDAFERLARLSQLRSTTRPIDRADRDSAEKAGPRMVGEVDRAQTPCVRDEAMDEVRLDQRDGGVVEKPEQGRVVDGLVEPFDQLVDDGCLVLDAVHCPLPSCPTILPEPERGSRRSVAVGYDRRINPSRHGPWGRVVCPLAYRCVLSGSLRLVHPARTRLRPRPSLLVMSGAPHAMKGYRSAHRVVARWSQRKLPRSRRTRATVPRCSRLRT